MRDDDLEAFVASLRIPDDRKHVVLAELRDHALCAARDGRDPREAIGDREALRRALEAIEPAFRVTRWHAFARGAVAGLVIALLFDQGGPLVRGVLGVFVSIALVAVVAPPRALDLLRAELRPRQPRLGPGATYLVAATSAPYLIWIGMILARGETRETLHVPWSAFTCAALLWIVVIVEGVRARHVAA